MKTQCSRCLSKFNVSDANVGKQARCPKCRELFTIQPFEEAPPVTPAATTASPKDYAGMASKIAENIRHKTEEEKQRIEAAAQKTEDAGLEKRKMTDEGRWTMEGEGPGSDVLRRGEQRTEEEKPAVVAAKPEPIAPPVAKPEPVTTTFKAPQPIAPQAQRQTPPPPPPPVKAAEPAREEPQTKTAAKKSLSKVIFIYAWIGLRIIAGALAVFGLMQISNKAADTTKNIIFAAADVFLVLGAAIELLLFYKMWSAIRDKEVSITGAKAVGFLFIPGFNIFWALLMLTGFPEDYNSFIHRRNIQTKDLPLSLYLIYAGLFILAGLFVTIPMLCIFALYKYIYIALTAYITAGWCIIAFVSVIGISHFIAYVLFASKTINAVNALQGNITK